MTDQTPALEAVKQMLLDALSASSTKDHVTYTYVCDSQDDLEAPFDPARISEFRGEFHADKLARTVSEWFAAQYAPAEGRSDDR